VSAEQGALFALQLRDAVLEHHGEVVQRLLSVQYRHRPPSRGLADRQVDQF